MAPAVNDPGYRVAALRSRLVSRLTGLSVSQLQEWHETELQVAHVRSGRRGVPRLYSWRDYHRLRVIAKLLEYGIPTARVRLAVSYLDSLIPDWFTRTLLRYEGNVLSAPGNVHIAVAHGDFHILADAEGQVTYVGKLPSGGEDELPQALARAISEMEREGPLFRLSRFDDAVRMRPGVNAGLPTLVNSRLETSFIARLAAETSIQAVARDYGIKEELIARVVEFEAAA